MKLKQEYGLDTFTLNDLVEESLKFFQENPNPIIRQRSEHTPIKESMHEDEMSKIED